MAETIGWPYPVLYTACSEMSLMKIALYSTINHSDSLIVAIQPLASLSLSLSSPFPGLQLFIPFYRCLSLFFIQCDVSSLSGALYQDPGL